MSKKIKLDDVLKYEQPTKYIVDSDIYKDEFDIPVLTAGKSFILGYTNETHGVFNDFPVIIFDDFTTAIKYVDFPFKVKSSAMKILKAKKEIADIKYLFYKMQTIRINSSEHKRYSLLLHCFFIVYTFKMIYYFRSAVTLCATAVATLPATIK
jgi:type I restriction enzyme S subunit